MSGPPPILILSGSPGAGKTSLSSRIAKGEARGLHLVSDVFYGFPAHPIDPTVPESHAQNTAIVGAVMQAAAAFAEAGYGVVVDGVLGPWWMPSIARVLHPRGLAADYLILTTDVEEAVRRATTRAQGADPRAVRHMHRAFAATEGFDRHVLDTTGVALEEVLRRAEARRQAGDLRLDLDAWLDG